MLRMSSLPRAEKTSLISACPTCSFGLIQHELEALINTRVWNDYRELSNASDLKLDLNAQTQSPWTALLSHLITSHSYDFYLALFSCLHSLLVAFKHMFIVPSGPPRIPSRRSSSGSSAWRETSSGRKQRSSTRSDQFLKIGLSLSLKGTNIFYITSLV